MRKVWLYGRPPHAHVETNSVCCCDHRRSITQVITQSRLERPQGRLLRLEKVCINPYKGNEYKLIIFESQRLQFSFRCKDLRTLVFICGTSFLLP
jgi:hypothetical protein